MDETTRTTEMNGDIENELDIIYHNMNAISSFRTLRALRYRTVEDQQQRLACQIQAGCFDTVISVAASKESFVVVMETSRSDEALPSVAFRMSQNSACSC
jgi:hypothetical protein